MGAVFLVPSEMDSKYLWLSRSKDNLLKYGYRKWTIFLGEYKHYCVYHRNEVRDLHLLTYHRGVEWSQKQGLWNSKYSSCVVHVHCLCKIQETHPAIAESNHTSVPVRIDVVSHSFRPGNFFSESTLQIVSGCFSLLSLFLAWFWQLPWSTFITHLQLLNMPSAWWILHANEELLMISCCIKNTQNNPFP